MVVLLILFLCIIPLAIVGTLAVAITRMKRSGYGEKALALVVVGLILLMFGSGLAILGIHTLQDADDWTDERTIFTTNQSEYSVSRELRGGDRIEIAFDSTITLDVIIFRGGKLCVEDWSEALIKNSRSGNESFKVGESGTFFVKFRRTESGNGSTDIQVKFDRSPSRHFVLVGLVISGVMITGSLRIFYWVYTNGRTDVPPIMQHGHDL